MDFPKNNKVHDSGNSQKSERNFQNWNRPPLFFAASLGSPNK